MVVNAIGAGWIIVIWRTLGTDGMQFFLCNHAHVVPIAVQLARTIVVVIAVAIAVCGFSANGQWDNKVVLLKNCCCHLLA